MKSFPIRIAGVLLAAAMLFTAAGCQSKDPEGESSQTLSEVQLTSSFLAEGLPASSETVTASSGLTSSEQKEASSRPSSGGNRTSSVPQQTQTPGDGGEEPDQGQERPTASEVQRETVRVTIPEGFTFLQVAKRLEANGVCTAQEFYETAQAYNPSSLTVPTSSDRAYKMEGYLYPDTYEFYVDDDPKDVLIKMLNNFRDKAGGITDEQLIVASIVEKESRSSENAAMVASVVYNRLKAGMKLEMDPTRVYVNENITGSPLLSDTSKYAALYNTYKCSGLPAGPICNPGNRAIKAALNPASSEYLYFFFGNDNQNHYSKTYEEHLAAMEQYGIQYGY